MSMRGFEGRSLNVLKAAIRGNDIIVYDDGVGSGVMGMIYVNTPDGQKRVYELRRTKKGKYMMT